MRCFTTVAVVAVLVVLCVVAAPSGAANDVLLRPETGTVIYNATATSPNVAITGVQAVAGDAYATTAAQSVGLLAFPDSSLVTIGHSTSVVVGPYRWVPYARGSTIAIPAGGALRIAVRRPKAGELRYWFSTWTMNVEVRGAAVALLSDGPSGDTLTCLTCWASDVVATVRGREYVLLTGETMRVTPAGKVAIDPTTSGVLQGFAAAGL